MLVLTRKKGERIVIADDIIVEILEAKNGKIRVGIIAPEDISIHREEIYKAMYPHKKLPSNRENI